MAWFRWHEGTSSDPKFHLIARKSGQPVAYAIAVWTCLLERASAADDRGDIGGFDCESTDAALGMPEGAAQAIYDAMAAKGMITPDRRIGKWEERQPKKEDATSTERVREHRARQREKSGLAGNEPQRQETHCNAVKRDETPCNELQRQETPDKIRRDKIKNNIKNPPLPPLGEGEGDGDEESSRTCPPEENLQPEQQDETPQDEPGIEFQEAREFWDSNMRCEGPMAGFKEYKTLKKARDRTGMSCWPGLGVIRSDVLKRKEARVWNPGYEIGLGRYLAEKTWLAPVVPRASPPSCQTGEKQSEGDRAAKKIWENYQRLKARGVVE